MNALVPCDVYPSLVYDDAPAAIEWVCRAFGFKRRLVVPGTENRIEHSELSFGSVVVMISSPSERYGTVGPRRQTGTSQCLILRVDDPDAHYRTAKAEGAEILEGLTDHEYGSRGYMARDPGGHVWYFATYRPGTYSTDDAELV